MKALLGLAVLSAVVGSSIANADEKLRCVTSSRCTKTISACSEEYERSGYSDAGYRGQFKRVVREDITCIANNGNLASLNRVKEVETIKEASTNSSRDYATKSCEETRARELEVLPMCE